MSEKNRIKNLAWSDELPAGWREIYLELIHELFALDPSLHVSQAKEKFGTFRVYLRKGSDAAYALIDSASRRSSTTCEICSAEARLVNDQGYYCTLCESHTPANALVQPQKPSISIRGSSSSLVSFLEGLRLEGLDLSTDPDADTD